MQRPKSKLHLFFSIFANMILNCLNQFKLVNIGLDQLTCWFRLVNIGLNGLILV